MLQCAKAGNRLGQKMVPIFWASLRLAAPGAV